MNQIKFNRSLVSLITGTLLLAAPVLRADTILSISQTNQFEGHLDTWGWQSFTVNTESTLTRFGFETTWWGADFTATAAVDLLSGEGTNGVGLASVTGHYVPFVNSQGNPMGPQIFTADFGSVSLTNGQYTVYFHDATAQIDVAVNTFEPNSGVRTNTDYTGGKFWDSYAQPYTAQWTSTAYDAQFYTPIPSGGGVSAVPEPSSLALLLIGVIGTGGYVASKRYRRAAQS